jgi:hypothetical protein
MSGAGSVRAITTAIRKFEPAAFVRVGLRGCTVSVAGLASEDQVRNAIGRFTYRGSA